MDWENPPFIGLPAAQVLTTSSGKPFALLLPQNPPANVNARNRYGQTPLLDVATHRKAKEAIARTNILIRLNADPKLRENDGRDFLYALYENENLTDQEPSVLP